MATSTCCRCISSNSASILSKQTLFLSSSPRIRIPTSTLSVSPWLPLRLSSFPSRCFTAKAARGSNVNDGKKSEEQQKVEEEEVEVEEELPWIQEKALDLVEFTGSVTQAIPGPRVGQSSFPWILAVPLAYLGVTFIIAFVKTVRKFNSPREKRRQLVSPPIYTAILYLCFCFSWIFIHHLPFTWFFPNWQIIFPILRMKLKTHSFTWFSLVLFATYFKY